MKLFFVVLPFAPFVSFAYLCTRNIKTIAIISYEQMARLEVLNAVSGVLACRPLTCNRLRWPFGWLKKNEKENDMDGITMQTVSLQLPSSDMKLLRELAKKMGWTAKKVKAERKMTEVDKAISDVNKGKVKEFESVKDMMNYLNA